MLLVDVMNQFEGDRVPLLAVAGWEQRMIDHVTIDSKKVGPTSLFVACPGALPTSRDGHDFIDKAIAQGAAGIVLQNPPENMGQWKIPVWQSENTRRAAARLAEIVWARPASHLTTIGITGTNGKTTTVRLIAHIMQNARKKVGFTTSDGIYIQNRMLQSGDCSGPKRRLLEANFKQILQNEQPDPTME